MNTMDTGKTWDAWFILGKTNMELIDSSLNLIFNEEIWKIYTKSDAVPPLYVSSTGYIEKSIVSGNSIVEGTVINSVIGAGVTIGEGTEVRDSIIMKNTVIGKGCRVSRAIIAEEVTVGDGCVIGEGEDIPNRLNYPRYILTGWRRSEKRRSFRPMCISD